MPARKTITKAAKSDFWLGTPGVYRKLQQKASAVISAHLSCPDCGETASLGDHTIDADGLVNPSLVCPHKGCAFHEFVVLEGWNGG